MICDRCICPIDFKHPKSISRANRLKTKRGYYFCKKCSIAHNYERKYGRKPPNDVNKYIKQYRWKAKNRSRYNTLVSNSRMRKRKNNPVWCILRAIKRRALLKNIEYNLTEEWYLAHYSQGCEVTGLDFESLLCENTREKSNPYFPHVDRIDPLKGYTMDNCRLVCAVYNIARKNWGDEPVAKMAKALLGD